ncbi:MAG TPA: hypothetical protein VEU28_06010 [Actinomycetota bacterium]|nr:hypothetical protein [Actinomycetota bacterium]
MSSGVISAGWFDHLSSRDLSLLSQVADQAGVSPGAVAGNPNALTKVLSHPSAFDLLFPAREDGVFPPSTPALVPASPFLAFAVVVHRSWADLQQANYVDEWVGPRQRLPVLGGDDLRDFLASDQRRLFLTELLTSYTRVTSGSTWVHTTRGWRRRRYSDLDPVRLSSLLEVVPEMERPGVYRRLGDLALFLTGVFPDHTELHGLGTVDEARLLRMSGLPERDANPGPPVPEGAVGLLERLGGHWYRLAIGSLRGPVTGTMSVVAEVAERFGPARRTLNYVTDRHLFAGRGHWFGQEAS